MADERNDEGIKGFGFSEFRTNADKFYRSPAAPMRPNDQQPSRRVTEQIKSPDGQIHWIVFKQSDNAQCSCGHRWWRAGACSYDSLSGKVSECPCCPMCNERRRIAGQWNEPLLRHLPIQSAIHHSWSYATPPISPRDLALFTSAAMLVGFSFGLTIGMWIGGLH